jgi:hypothetical protein
MAPMGRDRGTSGTAKNYISCRGRRSSSSSERCAGLTAIDVGAGTVFCLSDPTSAIASPRLESVRRSNHASIRPERVHGGQFLREIDEFCQDFIWFSRNRLYAVQSYKWLLKQGGATLTTTAVSQVPASAIRGIGGVAPHQYRTDYCGVSNRLGTVQRMPVRF